jgi:hypothetical protein
MTGDTGLLDAEKTAFEQQLPSLIDLYGFGKFALFVGSKFVGAFSTYKEALLNGYKRSKIGAFLVREISDSANVVYVSSTIEKRQ